MNTLAQLYRPSLALATDLYQLTMAYGYWKSGLHAKEAAFHLFFRTPPFNSGYSVACGLETALRFLENFHFDGEALEYLAMLTGADGEALFEQPFLDALGEMEFCCDVDTVPEGTVVFPFEPLLRVTGPVMQAQIVETLLLTILNFQTLIATKAARICLAARGEPVLEFGARRAQGIDGALTASRAAYVGGCAATSNVLAGRLFGIPVKGTHAHSWVMMFDDEREAFETYADAMPNNCVFLVDTYDTLQGVRHAVEIGRKLRADGHKLLGIRLDSGDLAWLSIEARKILDAAGFHDAAIVASNDLDEHLIRSLKEQGAKISVWGVGTRLATAYDQPALGGVYKLSAMREPGGDWLPRVKISEQTIKISNPGLLQVRRFRNLSNPEEFFADAIYDITQPPPDQWTVVAATDPMLRWQLHAESQWEELLVPALRGGRRVYEAPPLGEVREHTQRQLASLAAGVKRLENPHRYKSGLEHSLFNREEAMVLTERRKEVDESAR